MPGPSVDVKFVNAKSGTPDLQVTAPVKSLTTRDDAQIEIDIA